MLYVNKRLRLKTVLFGKRLLPLASKEEAHPHFYLIFSSIVLDLNRTGMGNKPVNKYKAISRKADVLQSMLTSPNSLTEQTMMY